MAYLSKNDLKDIGFKSLGDSVFISDKASIYNSKNIHLASNIRIDDFCILSAGKEGIVIENYVHIGAYSSLIGSGLITVGNFSNISTRVSIFSSNDDYSGLSMTNPTVPMDLRNVNCETVSIGKHVIVGSGSIILPGSALEDGVAIGALSLVKGRCSEFCMYGGVPLKFLKYRSKGMLDLESMCK